MKNQIINQNLIQEKKEKKCSFCGFPYGDDDNHEYYCGSKNAVCEYCGIKLLQMELNIHYKNCNNFIPQYSHTAFLLPQ